MEFATIYGSVLNYTCLEGFWFERGVHHMSRQCGIGGQWYPELADCSRKWNISDYSLLHLLKIKGAHQVIF